MSASYVGLAAPIRAVWLADRPTETVVPVSASHVSPDLGG
jgi:hypothetical protein